ncbi:MAG: tetratricopeptide repeat protein [Hyphomicrobium aestuarii]|nr:tetratricopeptide repeat protein [Hyphomicrobium aestuarii]
MPKTALPKAGPRGATRTRGIWMAPVTVRGAMSSAVKVATCLGIALIWAAVPQTLAARTAADVDVDTAGQPSLIGNYLSGRFARAENEPAKAAQYYRAALDFARDDTVLIEQSFQMETANGDWAAAIPLAERLVAINPKNRMAQTVLGLQAFKRGDLSNADLHFKASSEGPIGEITSSIARAWVQAARGDTKAALDLINAPRQADWAQFYLLYHRGLITDISGDYIGARAAFDKVFRQDSKTLRTALAYAHSLANAGDTTLARNVLNEHLDRQSGDGHPLARDLRDRLATGERVSLLVKTTSQGLSEVFYGLGEALAGEGGVNLGMVYLQLALFLSPDHPFALAALANAQEGLKKFEAANATYDLIPGGTALQSSIEIRKAFNLNSLDRVDEAKAILDRVSKSDPADVRPLEALGNIMRARKRYDEAIVYYSKAIDLVAKPEKRHWAYWYSRGTCYERVKKWPLAEADLQKALVLFPDQPLVLNYLGYSWVDQAMNLKQGLALIEKAVALRPDDGYIVDSLGWAYFKLGDFKEAVKYLERAVELRPEDPTLNDHLGDALWRVGRTLEANFQWEQALSLNPEPEEAEKMREKLVNGLPALKAAQPVKPVAKPKQTVETPRRRAQITPRREPVESEPEPSGDAVFQ